ncbi:MAG: universal stress protein [Alphaproteobacteria bacterium]|jgi:nucleotide-binding universal stress UspA family protein|nr:universal stress protein [Alphaproteobacteria bacterium]
MTPARILLASHGTPGARAAEQAALSLCAREGTIWHLEVVPDFWKGMRGDDWLNNAITQQRFGDYVESQLERELAEHAEALSREVLDRGFSYENLSVLGKPAECLLDAAARETFDLVVIGSPRPKGTPGYRSRMKMETLVRGLRIPLFVAPHPDR